MVERYWCCDVLDWWLRHWLGLWRHVMQSHVGYLSICIIRSSRSFQSAQKPTYSAVLLICLRTRFFFFIPTAQGLRSMWGNPNSGIQGIIARWIRKAQGIRNPANDWNLQSNITSSTDKKAGTHPSTWNPESTAWNSESKTVGLPLIHGYRGKEIKLIKSLNTNFVFNCPTRVSAVLSGKQGPYEPTTTTSMKRHWKIGFPSFHFFFAIIPKGPVN